MTKNVPDHQHSLIKMGVLYSRIIVVVGQDSFVALHVGTNNDKIKSI